MVFTSLWEFKCYCLPDLAEQEYREGLSSGELGALMALESLQELMRTNHE